MPSTPVVADTRHSFRLHDRPMFRFALWNEASQ